MKKPFHNMKLTFIKFNFLKVFDILLKFENMKKLLIISAFGLLVMVFESCKKDYKCECCINDETTSVEMTGSKSEAKSACEALETSQKSQDPGASCKLK